MTASQVGRSTTNATKTNELRIEETVLLVIDMQNDFCTNGGVFTRRGLDITPMRTMIPNLALQLERLREKGVRIIFVRAEYGRETGSPTWENRPGAEHDEERAMRLCQPGTWGAEIIDELKPMEDEPVVVKHRFSAFKNTNLQKLLERAKIRNVLISGVATNVCVETAAREAFMNDYNVIVLEDCVASDETELHAASLKNLSRHFARVMKSEKALAQLKAN